MLKSPKLLKCLLSVYFIASFSAQAQISLVKDSWNNAGNWWKSETYQKQDLWYWGIGIAAVGGTFIYDAEIQKAISFSNPADVDRFSPYMEPFGNPYYGGSVALLAYLSGEITNQSELSNVSSTALQSMLTAGLTVVGLKLLFHRVRPEEQMANDPYLFYGPSFNRDRLSFPSGHSAIAFSLAASISAYFDDPYYLAIPLYGLAGLTAWQRVYAKKHWPSDILMGGLIGVFIGRKIATWQKEKSHKLAMSPVILFGQNPGISLSLKLDPIEY